MNRRKFFNLLGSAIIGTVITLRLPDSIAPIKIFDSNDGIGAVFKLIDDDLKAAMATVYKHMQIGYVPTADDIMEIAYGNK